MNNKQNIIIIGMPGSGKTTFGQALAKRLGREFFDADAVIRDAEVRASQTLADKEGIVVACGGGVIKRQENIDIFKKTSILQALQYVDRFTP